MQEAILVSHNIVMNTTGEQFLSRKASQRP